MQGRFFGVGQPRDESDSFFGKEGCGKEGRAADGADAHGARSARRTGRRQNAAAVADRRIPGGRPREIRSVPNEQSARKLAAICPDASRPISVSDTRASAPELKNLQNEDEAQLKQESEKRRKQAAAMVEELATNEDFAVLVYSVQLENLFSTDAV